MTMTMITVASPAVAKVAMGEAHAWAPVRVMNTDAFRVMMTKVIVLRHAAAPDNMKKTTAVEDPEA
jgi:hypothetical protein